MSSTIAEPVRTSAIRVLIATGEPLFGDAVERVVRQCARLQFVGHAPNAHAALEQPRALAPAALARLRALAPDVAILGPSRPSLDGCRFLALMKMEEVPTRLVFVGDNF